MQIIVARSFSNKLLERHKTSKSSYLSFGTSLNPANDLLDSFGIAHINLDEIMRECRERLNEAVIAYGGRLNCNAPRDNWWAITLSRRVAMYPFWDGLAKLFLLREIAEKELCETCFVIDDSPLPWLFMDESVDKTGLKFVANYSTKDCLKATMKSSFPLKTIVWFLHKFLIKMKLGLTPSALEIAEKGRDTLFLTLIDRNNFNEAGEFRDIYLGNLDEHFVKAEHKPFLLGQLHGKLVGNLLKGVKKNNDFALVEHLWSVADLLNIFVSSLCTFWKGKKDIPNIEFAGFHLEGYLKYCLKLDLQGEYANNLLYQRAATILFQKIKPRYFVYPYENKCLERVFLDVISQCSSETFSIGYQHAVLTPKHIHMFLSKGEAKVLPLPKRIVTNGKHTAKLMDMKGNYPKGMVVAGTALRLASQVSEDRIKNDPPKEIKNVLICLAEGTEEYYRGFSFLREMQKINPCSDLTIKIRLHPGIPYDPFLDKNVMKGVSCEKDGIKSLLDSLYWADVVLYISTSVAIQAMAMGIPVVWMDTLDYWDTDPIFERDVLRWEASPRNIGAVMKKIEGVEEDDYRKRFNRSREIVSEYFSSDPVDIKKWIKINPE